MATVSSKRKRDSHDAGLLRGAPGLAGPPFVDDAYDHAFDTPDPNGQTLAEMLAQHQAPGEGEDDDDEHHHHHQHHHNAETLHARAAAGAAVNDTAAAAMAQYHTMTIPQRTEETFMQQSGRGGASGGGEAEADPDADPDPEARRTGSLDQNAGGDGSPTNGAAGAAGGEGNTSPGGAAGGGANKPAVGTEEWHKVRRDNHKEGMHTRARTRIHAHTPIHTRPYTNPPTYIPLPSAP